MQSIITILPYVNTEYRNQNINEEILQTLRHEIFLEM